jgi:hypothetical protein
MKIRTQCVFSTTFLLIQLCAGVGILFTSGKHFHDPIISKKEEMFGPRKLFLHRHFFIAPSQEREWSYICVCEIYILPVSTILRFCFHFNTPLLGEDYNQGNRLTFHLSELKNMYL